MPSTRFNGELVTLKADVPPADGRRLTELADSFLVEVSRKLDAEPPSPTVYVFGRRRDLRRFLRLNSPAFARRTGACFVTEDGNIIIALRASRGGKPALDSLRHELTHAVIAANFVRPMPWLDEGLAQCLEEGMPPGEPAGVLDALAAMNDIEDRVLRVVSITEHAGLTTTDYRVAWGLTWFLIQDGGYGWQAIRRCLEPPEFGETPAQRLARGLGLGPEPIARSFKMFLQRRREHSLGDSSTDLGFHVLALACDM